MSPQSAKSDDSLVSHVLQNLTDSIKNGVYPPGSKLPPENQLATVFDVSRATIRRALSKLAERDLILRKQGDGTYVANLSSITNPLNQFVDICDRIADHGLQPGFVTLSVDTVEIDAIKAKMLAIRPGSQALRVKKLFTADEKPIIYVENHIPIWVYQDQLTFEEIAQPGYTEPFFDFFRDKCDRPVKYYVSSIRPAIVRDLSLPDEMIFLDVHTPILILEDIGYDYEERPVFHSVEHIVSNSIDVQIVSRVEIY